MKDILRFLFRPSETDRETSRYAVKNTIRVTHIVVILVFLIGAVMLAMTYTDPEEFLNSLPYHRMVYLVLVVSSILWLAIARFVVSDFEGRYHVLNLLNTLMVVVMFGWSFSLVQVNAVFNDLIDTTPYLMITLLVPICVYVHPLNYLLIAIGFDLMMFIRLYQIDQIMQTRESEYAFFNFFSFTLMQVVSGLVLLYTRFSLNKELLAENRQHMEIERLSRSQNRFFSNMSHEIRTPINTIIGLNEMTLRENVSPEINENSENIAAAGNMLLHLINDILDMSKIESGQMEISPAPYKTGEMLSDIAGMFWFQAKKKGLDFRINIAPDFPSELYGDDVRIKQILVNVIGNGIKYTPEGSVTLSFQWEKISEDMAHIIYTVVDTGTGIKKENIPHLFTAFKREDEDQNRYIEGTGLGLSIVKQFVDLMGGTITVNSVYTEGSTFIIDIPQKIVSEEPVQQPDAKGHHLTQKKHGYRRTFEAPDARILAVDDTSANLLVVGKLLRDTRIRIDTASSGQEALEKTLNQYYHLILMDHLMPGMDGIECFRKIRSQTGGMNRETAVVALTANAGKENAELYAKEGFDGYLVKPVTGEDLENEVRRLLPKDLVTVYEEEMEITEESLSWIDRQGRKARVLITTESIADVPKWMLESYHIAVIPHMVKTRDGVFRDGLELDQEGVLSYMDKNAAGIRAVPPTVSELESFFAKGLQSANHVIHISISAQLEDSGCIPAREAARSFDNIFVVDSGHLSSGQGLMALAAGRMAQEGKSAEQIITELEELKKKIHTSFIVANLNHLAATGQMSEQTAKFANALMLHPVLVMKTGKMKVGRVFFGSRERAWAGYITGVLDMPHRIDKRLLFVTYVGLTQNDLDSIKAEIERHMDFDRIIFQKASPTIAVNSGAGTFGLLFLYT
ncbi:MAG: DegV family EDD domain-containing protein [Lachnospiraceae bacterium]|nr:DegV family EDD domain-containing protein [Lachnospiraceae bacterium]